MMKQRNSYTRCEMYIWYCFSSFTVVGQLVTGAEQNLQSLQGEGRFYNRLYL
jgi:hypothetical protein